MNVIKNNSIRKKKCFVVNGEVLDYKETSMLCPYCGALVVFINSMIVYRSMKSFGMIYLCSQYPACDSYVGAHSNTQEPKGTLANKELRYWRGQAHSFFDPLWKYTERKKGIRMIQRKRMYKFLAEQLKMSEDECHIAMFDKEQCKKVIEVCKNIQLNGV